MTVPLLALAGENRTVTVHDLAGPRLIAVQVSPVVVNAVGPISVTASTPVTGPPELASVNVCETGQPGFHLAVVV